MPLKRELVKGFKMTGLEESAATTFCFAFLLLFSGMREEKSFGSMDIEGLRLLVLGYIAISIVMYFAVADGFKLRTAILHLLVSLGSVEAAYWAGIWSVSMLAPRKEGKWNIKTDPFGWLLIIISGSGLCYFWFT